jgi:hypothetical protein
MLGICLEYATDHIWTMEDKEGFIGLRLDCGDSGVIYFTPSQAADVVAAFSAHLVTDKIMKIEFKSNKQEKE